MARNFTDKYYYRDDQLTAVDLEPVSVESNISVYEVIRIIGGQPLFLEDHIERLRGSLHSFGLKTRGLKVADFSDRIASLCLENDKDTGNIEILVTVGDKKANTILVGFIAHKYPEEQDYRQGVRVDIIEVERENPNTKVKDTGARLAANAFLAESNCFEVLLKNRNNRITEGSRSNFFFFKGDTLFSTPVAAVLPGITRKYVLIAAARAGLEIHEDFLLADQVKDLDAAFISGTSLGVLPVSHIGNHRLNPQHGQLQKLMKAYREFVDGYLSNELMKKSTSES
jgi:branched-chain amino acid aminotransferase